MKTFKEFIAEDGVAMVSAVPANSISAGGTAGVSDNNPPVFGSRRRKTLLTKKPLKRSAPIKM